MKLARAALLAAIVVAVSTANLPAVVTGQGESSHRALMVEIAGPIGPASARHVKEALTTAGERRAEVLILRLNTPGGLVSSTREIIADVLASPVPVVGYVAPSGGHAASAGTYILYATHVAAMAPGTNLGAATPIEIGGPLPGRPSDGDHDKAGKSTPVPAGSQDAMTAKVTNDAVAFIRSLAELRGRNADWAEKAVREAASLSASAALEARVIDLVADDTAEVLKRIDGRTVMLAGSRTRRLATEGLPVEILEPDWLIRLLSLVTDPNVAIILMLLGVYGLVFEFASPGAVAPGVVGIICLLLGLYALNLLPIDYAGLALMTIGIVFLVIEVFNPTIVLGLSGLSAFLLGAAMLFKVEAPGYWLSWTIIGAAAALIFGLTMFVGSYLWISRRAPARIGPSAMLGTLAEVRDWREESGHVFAQGERWQARGKEAFTPGETVEVRAIEGLTLVVGRRLIRAASDGEFR